MLRCALFLLAATGLAAAIGPDLPPGGANAPDLAPPPAGVLELTERRIGDSAVRIPTGTWTAPPAGAPAYAIPGPIAAFAGPDGVWRGHGYLETWSSLESFTGQVSGDGPDWTAELGYVFADERHYRVTLQATRTHLHISEDSQLGVRDVWVIDCAYDWQPTAALAFAADGRHSSRYLPCHYDRSEARIAQYPLLDPEQRDRAVAGLAVLSPRADAAVILALQAVTVDAWRDGDRMGIELWQHRQLPGDPASRHFLGPETKSDGTPNPHTAARIGQSAYEGHVTIELRLGGGSRQLRLAVLARPEDATAIPAAVLEVLR